MVKKESQQNPNILIFHVKKQLVSTDILFSVKRDWRVAHAAEAAWFVGLLRFVVLGRAGDLLKALEMADRQENDGIIRDLFDINGIEKLSFSTYSISITKGQAFEWTDIERDIESVLRTYNLDI